MGTLVSLAGVVSRPFGDRARAEMDREVFQARDVRPSVGVLVKSHR